MSHGWTRTFALLLCCAVAGNAFAETEAAPAPASAAAPAAAAPPCGGEPPPRMCQAAESAPRLANDDPRVKAILVVWSRVERPFAALTGRETALSVMAEAARVGEGDAAKPFSPTAFICPGAPPTVYVPYSLVDLVYEKKKYPDEFLAFVLGHELGHRANDFTPAGCQLAAFQRPGQGKNEEDLADKRSAFFTAIAGYSTRKLARQDIVGAFLAAEFGVRRFDLIKRKESLIDALGSFDALESLYQTAVALAMSGETSASARLLGWAEELIRGKGVPLPELLVARALVLMMEAAPNAPWLAQAKLPVDATHLRCAPIFAAHTALWEEPEAGAATRGASDEQEAAKRNLLLARRLLQEAEEMGAGKLTTTAGQACVAFYLGEHEVADRYQDQAMALVPKSAPKPVREAMQANQALVDFLRVLAVETTPALTDAKALAKWGKQLGIKKRGFSAHPQLFALVDALSKLPKRVVPASVASAPRCQSKTPPAPSPIALPEAAAPDRALGACPAGWKLAHTLPSLDVAKRTGSPTGVTTCLPADGRAGVRWVSVDLPGATSPPLEPLRVRMRIVEAGAAALPNVDAFACACGDGMQSMGVSDLGARAFMVACEPYGVGLGVLFAAVDGMVQRMVVIDND